MSLKFGIYLVEQRVISAEQFCGLVKIQQESSHTMATIALRKNLMTIKQVNNLLNLLENRKDIKFEELALQKGMIDSADLNVMLQSKEVSVPSIRQLLVECGLLTQRQAMVLFEHFEKHGYTGVQRKAASNDMPKSNIGKTLTPTPVAKPVKPTPAMPQPKFQQRRPVIQRQPTK